MKSAHLDLRENEHTRTRSFDELHARLLTVNALVRGEGEAEEEIEREQRVEVVLSQPHLRCTQAANKAGVRMPHIETCSPQSVVGPV